MDISVQLSLEQGRSCTEVPPFFEFRNIILSIVHAILDSRKTYIEIALSLRILIKG